MSLLNVKNLKIVDTRDDSVIVENVNFKLGKGRCLAIVGESGSGKSMSCKTILGLCRPWIQASGDVKFDGIDLLSLPKEELRKIRGKKICTILQDGMSAFDPSCVIGVHLREVLKEHFGYDKKTSDKKMIEAMESIMLKNPKDILEKYPHQLSGGMLQRIMIALALVLEPDVIIADEPTTALDSITQYEVIKQFQLLKQKSNTSMIFISHDLGVVKMIADDIVVFRNGVDVEQGSKEKIFYKPNHEYTKYLVYTRKQLSDKFKEVVGG